MWPNPQFPADLVTFNEEILNGKLHFLCNERENRLTGIHMIATPDVQHYVPTS